ncbi:MAG: putative transposase [Geminicoccaceae bacterium]|nr:putative transposase [Geminicoccaceae bacterium]
MRRYELSERDWRRLEPLLPVTRSARGGRPPKDRRRTVDGILWVLRTGAPWRDLPERYGPWSSAASTFYRWRIKGVWERVLAELQREADARGRLDWTLHAVDSTTVRAHQHAAGARRAGAIGG